MWAISISFTINFFFCSSLLVVCVCMAHRCRMPFSRSLPCVRVCMHVISKESEKRERKTFPFQAYVCSVVVFFIPVLFSVPTYAAIVWCIQNTYAHAYHINIQIQIHVKSVSESESAWVCGSIEKASENLLSTEKKNCVIMKHISCVCACVCQFVFPVHKLFFMHQLYVQMLSHTRTTTAREQARMKPSLE